MPNPPNSGPSHGRFRNTQKNIFSKFMKADPFPQRPSDIAGMAGQRSSLIYNNKVARGSLKAQAAQVRAGYDLARRGAIEAGRTGISEAAGAMADRGMTGSTVQQAAIQTEQGIAQGEIQGARFERDTGLLGVNISRLEADAQLRMGLSQLAAQRRAQQREMALAAYGSGGQNPWGY